MKRKIEVELHKWKSMTDDRMPLLVYGARQVGKTYLLKAFGDANYENVIYINFDTDLVIGAYFSESISPRDLIPALESYYSAVISPQKTLLIFDEIQASERALASLKYFSEEAPDYHVIGAGSLLGVAVNREKFNFPVGKVIIKHMCPMTFQEYLWAIGETLLDNSIRKAYADNTEMQEPLHKRALKLYRDYLIVGGMPAVVQNTINDHKTLEDGMIRSLILEAYTSDMAKYATASENIRTRSAYETIPAQLAKENKKFQYKLIKTGARASMYGDSIDWLIHSGTVLKCSKVTSGLAPTSAYQDLSSFKLYGSDIGLLCQQAGLTRYSIEQPITRQYLGGVTENYVACELTAGNHQLFYWESKGQAEIDFIIQDNGMPIPVEVKSSIHNRSRSLGVYVKQYQPSYSIRISEKNFGFENGIKSVPLYGVYCIRN